MTHLDALELRASNERGYIKAAKTAKEKQLREVWLGQINREISIEKEKFSGNEILEISDDELLAELLEG